VTLPPYGELASEEQRLEGRFRAAHAELIANCEQIAFLGGEVPEKGVLDKAFATVLAHLSKTRTLNFNSEAVRQYLNKYFVTVIGLYLVALPVLTEVRHSGAGGGLGAASADQISQYFVSTWRNMEAMATAIQDLFELTNRVGRLGGYASRVKTLMVGLQDRPPSLQQAHILKSQNLVFYNKYTRTLTFQNFSTGNRGGRRGGLSSCFRDRRGSRVRGCLGLSPGRDALDQGFEPARFACLPRPCHRPKRVCLLLLLYCYRTHTRTTHTHTHTLQVRKVLVIPRHPQTLAVGDGHH